MNAATALYRGPKQTSMRRTPQKDLCAIASDAPDRTYLSMFVVDRRLEGQGGSEKPVELRRRSTECREGSTELCKACRQKLDLTGAKSTIWDVLIARQSLRKLVVVVVDVKVRVSRSHRYGHGFLDRRLVEWCCRCTSLAYGTRRIRSCHVWRGKRN